MNTVQYKGFDIAYASGKFCIQSGVNEFNCAGYLTQAAAKGAITKHLNALGVTGIKLTHGNARISLTAPAKPTPAVRPSRNKREGKFVGCNDKKAIRLGGSGFFIKSLRYEPANRKQRKALALRSKVGA